MALETGTYISDLVSTNPVHASDDVSQGDDHIRLIKSTLLNTFPNVTGAMNASHTELNLLVGLSGVQPLDTDLTAIAALTSAADKMPYATGAGTWALADLTAFARTLIDDANQAAMQTTLGLVPGTDVQAQDAELAALAGLTSAADKLPYFTGSGTASLADLTSFARTLLDDADAGTARATLGANDASNLSTGTLPAARLPAASTSAVGGVELATGAETYTGTDTTRALTADGVQDMVFAARIDGQTTPAFDATSPGASGWSVSRIAQGQWRVTHSLGLSTADDMIVVPAGESSSNVDTGAKILAYNVNYFDIVTYDGSLGVAIDVPCSFVAMRVA